MGGSGMADERYREKARQMYDVVEGDLEVDDDAKVSRNDEERGAYVEAWVWVPDDRTRDGLEVVIVACPECGTNEAEVGEEGQYVCLECGTNWREEETEG